MHWSIANGMILGDSEEAAKTGLMRSRNVTPQKGRASCLERGLGYFELCQS
ncbi:MAG: hypothetical protein ACM37W_06455 [Actinomycetota bacterium]